MRRRSPTKSARGKPSREQQAREDRDQDRPDVDEHRGRACVDAALARVQRDVVGAEPEQPADEQRQRRPRAAACRLGSRSPRTRLSDAERDRRRRAAARATARPARSFVPPSGCRRTPTPRGATVTSAAPSAASPRGRPRARRRQRPSTSLVNAATSVLFGALDEVASSSLNGSPRRCGEWPAPGQHGALCAERSTSTSQTASNAALCAPVTTSFGNGAAASASSGISASHGWRSTISVRAPCSSAVGVVRAGSGEPTAVRNARRNASGSPGPSRQSRSRPRRTRRRPGLPRATPNAGGSITVSERSELGPPRRREERDHAAVGVADEVRARLEELLEPTASSSKSTRSTSGPGGKPRRFGTTSSKRSASGRWAPRWPRR